MTERRGVGVRVGPVLGTLVAAAFAVSCAEGGSDPGTGVGTSFHFQEAHTVPAGEEYYYCYFVNVETGGTEEEPVGVERFAYQAGSTALHHIIVFSSENEENDGDRPCELIEGGWFIRYAGGTATDPLEMPDDVAMPVAPVETFVIQFHYLNASDDAVVDDTTVDIRFTAPGESFTPAGLLVAGSDDFEIPPMTTGYEVKGTCNVPTFVPSVNVFAIWPHMHQTGRHFKIDLTHDGQTSTVWDEPFAFGDQSLYVPADEYVIAPGDRIDTTCTYDNPTDDVIPIGESSTQEMCFDFFFYYPAIVDQMLPCFG